jgi:hypothetical protein
MAASWALVGNLCVIIIALSVAVDEMAEHRSARTRSVRDYLVKCQVAWLETLCRLRFHTESGRGHSGGEPRFCRRSGSAHRNR